MRYDLELGRYHYRWRDRDFLVYVTNYWESDWMEVANHYIVYPRSHDDVKNGKSILVDELITAAAKHRSEIRDEVWVYDRGYWKKSHNLWQSVQGCEWENVILNEEVKELLLNDVEGFFERQKDYEAFAVPWKVS